MKSNPARTAARLGAAALVISLAAGPLWARPIDTVYLAGVWDDDSVHCLNADLVDVGTFAAGAVNPNALATNGTEIWTGHASTHEVIIYNTNGTETGLGWSDPVLAHVQGMEFIPSHVQEGMEIIFPEQLAIATDTEIRLHDPYTGAFVRTIISAPDLGVYTEGLAWDGQVLWRLALDKIIATDITDGSTVAAINNPALWLAGQAGKGLASNAPGQLTVVSETGNWWVVDTATGGLITSGDNAPDAYALKAVAQSVAVPEPITASVLLAGLVPLLRIRRRRRRA